MKPERSIEELVAAVLGQLERLKYAENTRAGYRRTYRRLVRFADSAGEKVYSESLGNRFLQANYAFDLDTYTVTLYRSFRNEVRCIRVLGDYQLHGAILRRGDIGRGVRARGFPDRIFPVGFPDILDHDDGIEAGRDDVAGIHPGDILKRDRVLLGCTYCISACHRDTVHRRKVDLRH